MVESRIVIGDFLTGRNILDLEVVSDRWESRRNAPDDLSCTITLADPSMRALGLYNAATAGKTFLAKIIGDNVMAFGLMSNPLYNRRRRTFELRARGDYFSRRSVIPLAALTEPLIDPVTGEANPLTNTVLTGWDLGTILKKIVQQSMLFPGGDLPIIFEDDRVGTHEDTILGSDLVPIGRTFDNYAARDNGPDWEFAPRLTADRLGIELLFRTGTEEQPRLRSASIHQWDYSVPEPGIDDLEIEIDATSMSSLAWTTGGRSAGNAMVTFAQNPAQLAAGFPLFESVDTDHSSASDPATIQSYSDERIRTSAAPTQFWPFRVRTDQSPFPGEYGVGDLCDIIVRDDDLIPDGTYRREIAALSGTEDPNWITVTTTEAPLG